jgi:hypothetical protein
MYDQPQALAAVAVDSPTTLACKLRPTFLRFSDCVSRQANHPFRAAGAIGQAKLYPAASGHQFLPTSF